LQFLIQIIQHVTRTTGLFTKVMAKYGSRLLLLLLMMMMMTVTAQF
jgi:hypothetical protein